MLTLFGVLLFLFLFWRKLREDYPDSQIFSASFFILFGICLGSLVSIYVLPDWWFWLAFLGEATGLFIGILRFHLRVFETIEAGVIATLPLLGVVFLYNFLQKGSHYSFFGIIVVSLLYVLFLFLDKRYKTFTWYGSGRIGFSGLTVLGLFFIIRAVIAVTSLDVLSFVGENDAIFSGLLAFLSFFAIFNLARKTT